MWAGPLGQWFLVNALKFSMTIIRSAQMEIIPDMSINMLYRNAKTKIALLLSRYRCPGSLRPKQSNIEPWTCGQGQIAAT
jgi:hypothetical protein